MSPQSLRTPVAFAAGEVDFTDDTASHEPRIVCGDNFADEFMTGSACEAVVSTLQFEIGIADAPQQEPNRCKSPRPAGPRNAPNGDFLVLEMDRKHNNPL